MSGPELPQPIYPTGQPAPGPAGAPQPGPVPGYGPPPGPPPVGGGGFSGGGAGGAAGGNRNLLIAGGVVVVLVLVAIVAAVLLQGGDDDDGGNTASNGTAAEPGGDVSDRAQRVAEVQVIGASSSTVSCIAGALEGEPELLDAIEDQPNGVAIDDAGQAQTYASLIMGCASVDEVVDNLAGALTLNGYDEFAVGCFEEQAQMLSSSDWEEVVQVIVQPSRSSELEEVLGTLTLC